MYSNGCVGVLPATSGAVTRTLASCPFVPLAGCAGAPAANGDKSAPRGGGGRGDGGPPPGVGDVENEPNLNRLRLPAGTSELLPSDVEEKTASGAALVVGGGGDCDAADCASGVANGSTGRVSVCVDCVACDSRRCRLFRCRLGCRPRSSLQLIFPSITKTTHVERNLRQFTVDMGYTYAHLCRSAETSAAAPHPHPPESAASLSRADADAGGRCAHGRCFPRPMYFAVVLAAQQSPVAGEWLPLLPAALGRLSGWTASLIGSPAVASAKHLQPTPQ